MILSEHCHVAVKQTRLKMCVRTRRRACYAQSSRLLYKQRVYEDIICCGSRTCLPVTSYVHHAQNSYSPLDKEAVAHNKAKTRSQSSATWDTISFILGERPAKQFVFGWAQKTGPNTKEYFAGCAHGRQLALRTSHPATLNTFHIHIIRDVFPKQFLCPNQCFPQTNNTLTPRCTSSQLTRRTD